MSAPVNKYNKKATDNLVSEARCLLLGDGIRHFFCLYSIPDRSIVSSGLVLYTLFYSRIFGANTASEVLFLFVGVCKCRKVFIQDTDLKS